LKNRVDTSFVVHNHKSVYISTDYKFLPKTKLFTYKDNC